MTKLAATSLLILAVVLLINGVQSVKQSVKAPAPAPSDKFPGKKPRVGVKSGHSHVYKMFVFGDSFADNGNLPRWCSSPITRQWHYPYGASSLAANSLRPTGRFSDHLVQPDILATMLNMGRLEGPPACKMTLKNYCNAFGMNFAVGGSGVFEPFLPPLPHRLKLTTLAAQIDQFEKLLHDRVIGSWNLEDSIALVAISGNDYTRVANASSNEIFAFVKNVTTEIAANVKRLQDLGINKILVNNLHPLGCTPWQARPSNYTKCAGLPNVGSSVHNTDLLDKLGGMENVKIVDLNTAFSKIVGEQPPGSGSELAKRFKYTLRPCCESSDPDGFCGEWGEDEHDRLYTLCKDPSKHFYWDDVHPTQAGWQAVMDQLKVEIQEFLDVF
ncbi:GDSL esterase/lipase At3g09930 [Brachypodium distachyon]|uniref:SGNH hydrolase-type esterase domain-containing protein n=1 Tax=Brachypodium distachyon TaxID=15368 RepID=I1IJI1_BRADI|nr:GDSL esterase/lipase At3g09930 [Brachypodium distachyon]KQJ87353.1 hypothetical protein BRADI_4g10460v3 [Brachypodium distachyon]|eukprot:XP_024311167.1 GDSL esterase/lipase At3g09930 [Brachypodium distachyon]